MSTYPDERCREWILDLMDRRKKIGIFSALSDPLSGETLARSGYDWVMVDLQHGSASDSELQALLQAIEGAGAAPIVRVKSADSSEIGRVLDCGAWVVVVPMVDSAQATADAVAATKYAPNGSRSFGPFRGRAALDDLPRCLVMIETQSGLEHVDEICAVDGLLGVFVGPSDLALSLDVGLEYPIGSGAHHDAIGEVSAAAARANVVAAIQTAGPDEAVHRVVQGFHMVSMRSDLLALRTAVSMMRVNLDEKLPNAL